MKNNLWALVLTIAAYCLLIFSGYAITGDAVVFWGFGVMLVALVVLKIIKYKLKFVDCDNNNHVRLYFGITSLYFGIWLSVFLLSGVTVALGPVVVVWLAGAVLISSVFVMSIIGERK